MTTKELTDPDGNRIIIEAESIAGVHQEANFTRVTLQDGTEFVVQEPLIDVISPEDI